MNILILSSKVPYPPKDGGSVATLGIARGLSQSGQSVSLMCLNTRKHFISENEYAPLRSQGISLYVVYHDTTIKVLSALFNLIFSRQPYNAIRFYSHEFEKKLTGLLGKENFDIIQLEGPYMGYYIPAIRKISTAKISLRAHNTEYELWARKSANTRNPFKKYYFNLLSKRIKNFEKRILTSTDLLVPISDRDQATLRELNPSIPSLVAPAGMDPDGFSTRFSPEEIPSLFFIGSLDWTPNLEGIRWFLDAVWPLLAIDERPDFHIAGRSAPGWLIDKLRQDGLHFHGEVEDAREYMMPFSVMVAPLFSGSGLRVKILEAMMMQKAVITTRIGAEGIPCTHGKDILIAENEGDFASHIRNIRRDKQLFNRIAENGRKLVMERFNNLAICKNLEEFYLKHTQ